MASFRSLSADDVRAILRAFGAPEYRAHRAIAVGTINTNLRVETADGPRFLRVNEGKSEEDVAREAAIVAHAAARGVPTPAPAHAPGGQPYVRFSDAFVSLFPWLPGRTLARAHARTGDRIAIAAYVCGSDTFDRAVAEFAAGYADLNEQDHRALAQAVAAGKVSALEGV